MRYRIFYSLLQCYPTGVWSGVFEFWSAGRCKCWVHHEVPWFDSNSFWASKRTKCTARSSLMPFQPESLSRYRDHHTLFITVFLPAFFVHVPDGGLMGFLFWLLWHLNGSFSACIIDDVTLLCHTEACMSERYMCNKMSLMDGNKDNYALLAGYSRAERRRTPFLVNRMRLPRIVFIICAFAQTQTQTIAMRTE